MSSALGRRLVFALDIAAVILLAALRWSVHSKGLTVEPFPGSEELPAWWWHLASSNDLMLLGYDAEQWFYQAATMFNESAYIGFRPPLWPMAVAALSPVVGDTVLAGHLLNHLLGASVPALTYLLGRSMGGRAVGLGAGVVMALLPISLLAQRAFSIEGAFIALPVALALCAWWVSRRRAWTLALLGAAVGLAWTTHILLGLVALSLLPLVVLSRRTWAWRATAALLVPAAGAAVAVPLLVVTNSDVWLSWQSISSYLGQAMVSINPDAAPDAKSTVGQALPALLGQIATSIPRIYEVTFSDIPHPWLRGMAGVAWLLGILGIGLRSAGAAADRWDWRTGLWLLALQAPIWLVAATHEPVERYCLGSFPFVYLAVARGTASLGTLAGRLLPTSRQPMLARGLILALCLGLALPIVRGWHHKLSDIRHPPQLVRENMLQRKVGRFIRDRFGPGLHVLAPGMNTITSHAVRLPCSAEFCGGQADVPWKECAAYLLLFCDDQTLNRAQNSVPDGSINGQASGEIPYLAWRDLPLPGKGPPTPPALRPGDTVQKMEAYLYREVSKRRAPLKRWVIGKTEYSVFALDRAWLRSFQDQ